MTHSDNKNNLVSSENLSDVQATSEVSGKKDQKKTEKIEPNIIDVLYFAKLHQVTDVFLKSDAEPKLKRRGILSGLNIKIAYTGRELTQFLRHIFSSEEKDKLENLVFKENSDALVCCVTLKQIGRLRIMVSACVEGISVVFHFLYGASLLEGNSTFSVISDKTLSHKSGLILICGGSGQGITSTAACLIDKINQRGAGHILTLEESVEYLHGNKKSVVSQRQIPGEDKLLPMLEQGYHSAVDVLYLDRIDDHRVAKHALDYAGAGCLVISHFNVATVPEAISKFINRFPAEDRKSVQKRLSENLSAVFCQKLVYEKHLGKPSLSLKYSFMCNDVESANKGLILEGAFDKLEVEGGILR